MSSRSLSSKARSVVWARRVVNDPATVFLDTETTGLDGRAEIVDIAVVDHRGNVLLETLIRPAVRIPAEASSIHGIYDHRVVGAPSWEQVCRELAPLLANRRIVVFNAGYDRRIIRQCCAQSRLPMPDSAWECAMLAYAEYVGERSPWGKGYTWHKLDKAAAAFGISPGGHRALTDADVCRRVVHGMAMT
jgi:DNA polymerase III subunit epsilon